MEQNKQENRKTVTVDVAIKSNDYIHNRLKYELRKRAGNKEYEYISNSNNICVQIYIYIYRKSVAFQLADSFVSFECDREK